jgi:hypothetical protein
MALHKHNLISPKQCHFTPFSQTKKTNMKTPNTLYFNSPSKIEPEAWSIMGINSKPNSDNPIGHFGTGLKMSLAVLLREQATVSIVSEDTTYEFKTSEIEFRGKKFQIIECNGERLNFTTELGKEWTIQNAYRELVSNTMDEEGSWGTTPNPNFTTHIRVTHPAIVECFNKHEEIFIGKRVPLAENKFIRIYPGAGELFFRGVRVGKIPNSMFAYEILGKLTLTEDRTVKNIYDAYYEIRMGIEQLQCVKLLRRIFTAPEGTWEHQNSYYGTWGLEMKQVVKEIWEEEPTTLVPALQRMIRDNVPDAKFKEIETNSKQKKMLGRALEFLIEAGIGMEAEIKLIENSDNYNIAFVHDKKIHLTQRAFEQGMFYLVTTLLEEYFHTIGYHDETRKFESHLMNLLVESWAEKQDVVL